MTTATTTATTTANPTSIIDAAARVREEHLAGTLAEYGLLLHAEPTPENIARLKALAGDLDRSADQMRKDAAAVAEARRLKAELEGIEEKIRANEKVDESTGARIKELVEEIRKLEEEKRQLHRELGMRQLASAHRVHVSQRLHALTKNPVVKAVLS